MSKLESAYSNALQYTYKPVCTLYHIHIKRKAYTMFNSYMLSSNTVKKVYIAWVIRYEKTLKSPQRSPEYQHAFQQVKRMQEMYDSLEGGKIIYLWEWHKMAIGK